MGSAIRSGDLTMRIRVNGKPRDVEAGLTVAALLVALGVPERVAVAVNGRVVPRSEFPRTPLADRDDVEIIHAVAGG
jgi:sulfur carrier protein